MHWASTSLFSTLGFSAIGNSRCPILRSRRGWPILSRLLRKGGDWQPLNVQVFHSRPVTSELAPTQKKADHGQGVSGTGIPLQEASKFFVIKVLTSNPLGLKILQSIFAEPAPVKTFREGGGRGVPLAFNVFPKRNCCRTSDRTPQANYFFDTFPPYLIPPKFCATFVLNS